MAQNTAQYEGLQYSSQAPVFDYGSITRGVNTVVEKKRLEDEAKAKELEAQKAELIKEYGDEIYSTFELTGLENADQLGLETKNLIIDTAENIQRRLTNGEITQSEATREMMMARNQSKKASESMRGLSEYANQIRSKEDISPADALKLDRIDDMIGNGVSVAKDSRGNYMFLSKENGKMVASPFSKFPSYMTFSDNIKPDSVLEAVMKDSATNEYYGKEGVVWKSKLGKDNKLTTNQLDGFKGYLKGLSGESLYNLAINSEVDVPKAKLDGTIQIDDEQSVRDAILTKLEEQAQVKYGNKALDEKTGESLRAQLYKAYKTDDEPKVSTPKKTKDGRDLYTLDTSGQKTLNYSFKTKPEEGVFGPAGKGQEDYSDFKINSYVPSGSGKPALASITYSEPVFGPRVSESVPPAVIGTRKVTKDITVYDQTDEEWLKTQVGVKTPEEVITPAGNAGDQLFNTQK